MISKTMLVPERQRVLAPPFAWIDRRFLFDGFLAALSHHENLLYFFLVLAADRDGLSFYGYDKICQLLQLAVDDYIQARNGLIANGLIAFDGRQFQVLALPKSRVARPSVAAQTRGDRAGRDAEALANILARLTSGGIDER
ncbi:MAG: hypothetical protein QN127_11350 [Armatimonadota bacterium]|nr:hypothetical protein [Armatimonadota bacterium]